MEGSNVWLWRDADCRWKADVIQHIKDQYPCESDLSILHCQGIENFEGISLNNYLLNICRKFKVFDSERPMFLNLKDLLQTIELCLGRLETKDDSSANEILDAHILLNHKTYIDNLNDNNTGSKETPVTAIRNFLRENNCIDIWLIAHQLSRLKSENSEVMNDLRNNKILILGSPSSAIVKEVISLLSSSNTIHNIFVETPLDISLHGSPSDSSPGRCTPSKIEVISEDLNVKLISFDDDNDEIIRSATEEYVEDTIIAFMSLLVNSRNELSLCKAMTSPIIDLSHEAFTALKHLSHEKQMPMCQTAISYVTRIRLGGKGYAPPKDCRMLPHLKSLEIFVDLLNQMQTLIEEDLTPFSAIRRLINILKKKLLKCGSEKLKVTMIDTAADNLKDAIPKVIAIMKSEQCSTSAPQICQETLDVLYYFVNYINCSSLIYDPQKILQLKETKRTPINLPPLLGYFRSPEDESTCDSQSTLNEDSRSSTQPSLILTLPSFGQQFDIAFIMCKYNYTFQTNIYWMPK